MLKRNWKQILLGLPVWVVGFVIGIAAPWAWDFIRNGHASKIFFFAPKTFAEPTGLLGPGRYWKEIANLSAWALAGLVLIVVIWVTIKEEWTPLRIVFLLGIFTPSALWLLLLYSF